MKLNYSDYIKRSDASVLVAEAIFTQLSEDYASTTISEVADTTSGGTPARSKSTYYGGEIPWLKSGELNDGLISAAEEFITEEGLKNSSAKLHPIGTLLLAMYGATAGRTGILGIAASTNQAVCALYAKPIIERDFLFWFLRQERFRFIERSKGGAQPNISQGMIKDTMLPIPPKKLQKTIAEILFSIEKEGKIDIGIVPKEFKGKVGRVLGAKNSVLEITTELTHQQTLVKQLRQQLLQEAVQGKLSTDQPIPAESDLAKQYGKLWHASGAELLAHIRTEKAKLIKEKKIKADKPLPPITEEEMPFDLPEGWVWVRLGEVALSSEGGKSLKAGEDAAVDVGEWGVLKTSAITSGELIPRENKKFANRAELYQGIKIAKGDLIFCRASGSKELVGVSCLVGKDPIPNLILSDKTIRYFLPAIVSKEWIHLFNSSEYGRRHYRSKSTNKSTSMNNITREHFNSLAFPLPPLLILHRIVALLAAYQGLCASLEAQIQESLTLNGALLQEVLREALSEK